MNAEILGGSPLAIAISPVLTGRDGFAGMRDEILAVAPGAIGKRTRTILWNTSRSCCEAGPWEGIRWIGWSGGRRNSAGSIPCRSASNRS